MRRGLTWREALGAVECLLGTSKSSVEKYLNGPVESSNAESDTLMALAALAKYRTMIEPRIQQLTPQAGTIIRDMTSRWR